MDGLTPTAFAHSSPHILLTGSSVACDCVREAIGNDYHTLTVPDGRRALRVLRSMRHLVLVVACDNLGGMDAPGLFARLAAEPEIAIRHSYIYLTAEARRFDVAFAWHLELLRAIVVHVPAVQHDLLEEVASAARLARLHALGVGLGVGGAGKATGYRAADLPAGRA